MGYKYRNGSTPDHVNSADSTSVPTPSIAPKDNTRVAQASGPDADSRHDKFLVKSNQMATQRMDLAGDNSILSYLARDVNADHEKQAKDRMNQKDAVKATALKTASLTPK